MPEYKTLEEMGITNPLEIDRYSVQTIERGDEHMDVLRVVYKRRKGSLLPESKRFRYPRIKKARMQNSGTRKVDLHWEISPFLQKAVAELEQIIEAEYTKQEKIDIIFDEMQRLEQDAAVRIEYIRSLVKSL